MEYSLKGQAFDYIKEKIVNCTYKPNMVLSEAELIKEMDISRTPIREAICKLEQEGLVQVLPKRGIVVTDISISEVSMIFEARLRTEPYILENYLQSIDLVTLEEIYRQMTQSPMDEAHYARLYVMDDMLHRTICRACPNPYIRKPMMHLLDQSNRLRYIAGKHIHERQYSSTQEHIKLLYHILNNMPAQASEAMTEHLINSRDETIRAFLNTDISLRYPELHL